MHIHCITHITVNGSTKFANLLLLLHTFFHFTVDQHYKPQLSLQSNLKLTSFAPPLPFTQVVLVIISSAHSKKEIAIHLTTKQPNLVHKKPTKSTQESQTQLKNHMAADQTTKKREINNAATVQSVV